mgnify:CR=1 FL=1
MLAYLDNLTDYIITPWGDYDFVVAKPDKTVFSVREERITSALIHRDTHRVQCLGLPHDHPYCNNPNIVFRSVVAGKVSFRYSTWNPIDLSDIHLESPIRKLAQIRYPILLEENFLYSHTAIILVEGDQLQLIGLTHLSSGDPEPQEEVQAVIETFLEHDDV